MEKFSKYYAKVKRIKNRRTRIRQIRTKFNPYLFNWTEKYLHTFSMNNRHFYEFFGYRVAEPIEDLDLKYILFDIEENKNILNLLEVEPFADFEYSAQELNNTIYMFQYNCNNQENFNVIHSLINFIFQRDIRWSYVGRPERRELTLLILDRGFSFFGKVDTFKEIYFWFRFLKPLPSMSQFRISSWLSYDNEIVNYKFRTNINAMRIPKRLKLAVCRKYLAKYKRKYNLRKLRSKKRFIRLVKLLNMRQLRSYDKYKLLSETFDEQKKYTDILALSRVYDKLLALHKN